MQVPVPEACTGGVGGVGRRWSWGLECMPCRLGRVCGVSAEHRLSVRFGLGRAGILGKEVGIECRSTAV